MKDRNDNPRDKATLRTWVDDDWSEIADLIDNIDSIAEIKTPCLGKKVEISKNVNKVYVLIIAQQKGEWVYVKIRYYQIKPLTLHILVHSNVFA